MNILYVYAHPNPYSFNAMLRDSALATLRELNQSVILSDLYVQQFDAVASWKDFNLQQPPTEPEQYFLAQNKAYQNHQLTEAIDIEINKLSQADHIFLQFPFWWFSVPAIMKGWLDKVLVKGFAYDAGKVFANGLLKGKTASLILTTQSPESAYQPDGVHGATIDIFLHHIHHTMRFVGIAPLAPFVAYGAFNLEGEQQEKIKEQFRGYLQEMIAK